MQSHKVDTKVLKIKRILMLCTINCCQIDEGMSYRKWVILNKDVFLNPSILVGWSRIRFHIHAMHCIFFRGNCKCIGMHQFMSGLILTSLINNNTLWTRTTNLAACARIRLNECCDWFNFNCRSKPSKRYFGCANRSPTHHSDSLTITDQDFRAA